MLRRLQISTITSTALSPIAAACFINNNSSLRFFSHSYGSNSNNTNQQQQQLNANADAGFFSRFLNSGGGNVDDGNKLHQENNNQMNSANSDFSASSNTMMSDPTASGSSSPTNSLVPLNNFSTKILYRLAGPSPLIPSSPVGVIQQRSNSTLISSTFNNNNNVDNDNNNENTSRGRNLNAQYYYWFPSNFTTLSAFYHLVPSLADRGLNHLSKIDEEGHLAEDTRALCLRLCEVSYEVQQDEEIFSELERIGHLLRKINAHPVYRESFRGLELVTAWSDGVIFYHAKSDTLIAACRGTHTEQLSWARDLSDGFIIGVASRVERLQREIHNLVRSPDQDVARRFFNSRVLCVGHSLGGSMATRFAFANGNLNNVYGIAFNPGEVFLSMHPSVSKLFPGNRTLFETFNKRFVMVKKPGDFITSSVEANCLIINDDSHMRDEHRLFGFRPTVAECGEMLHQEHEIVLLMMLIWINCLLCFGLLVRYYYYCSSTTGE